MYSVGDKIIYGGTGVCVVEEITTMRENSRAEGRLYYVLRPCYQTGIIRTPVDNAKVPVRPILSREEANRLVDSMPGVEAVSCNEKNLSALRNHYQAQLSTFNCMDLVRMTRSIYAKKKEAEQRQKKIGLTDEKYLQRAEDLLYGELAVSLDIPRERVEDYISSRLGAKENQ